MPIKYLCSAVTCLKAGVILSFERYQKEIKIYTKDMKLKERVKIPLRSEGFVLDVAFSDQQMLYGCTASDMQLHFFVHTTKGLRFLKSIPTECI